MVFLPCLFGVTIVFLPTLTEVYSPCLSEVVPLLEVDPELSINPIVVLTSLYGPPPLIVYTSQTTIDLVTLLSPLLSCTPTFQPPWSLTLLPSSPFNLEESFRDLLDLPEFSPFIYSLNVESLFYLFPNLLPLRPPFSKGQNLKKIEKKERGRGKIFFKPTLPKLTVHFVF